MKLFKIMKTISAGALVAAASIAVAQPAYDGLGANGIGLATEYYGHSMDAMLTYNTAELEMGIAGTFLIDKNPNTPLDTKAYGVELFAGYKHSVGRHAYLSFGPYVAYEAVSSTPAATYTAAGLLPVDHYEVGVGMYLAVNYLISDNLYVWSGFKPVTYGHRTVKGRDKAVTSLRFITRPSVGIGYTF